jgi:hypothetical protein
MFDPVWIIRENTKPRGPRSSATQSEQWHRCADSVQTAAATLSTHGFACHFHHRSAYRFRRPRPPPRVALRGAPRQRAPPFFSFHFHLTPILLAVRLYHRYTRRRREAIVAFPKPPATVSLVRLLPPRARPSSSHSSKSH